MPIQFREEDKGKILEVHVSGSLVKEDYARFVPIFCRPFTKAVIKYFNIADLAGARKWLAEGEEIHHER